MADPEAPVAPQVAGDLFWTPLLLEQPPHLAKKKAPKKKAAKAAKDDAKAESEAEAEAGSEEKGGGDT
jgi:hypothetical protein